MFKIVLDLTLTIHTYRVSILATTPWGYHEILSKHYTSSRFLCRNNLKPNMLFTKLEVRNTNRGQRPRSVKIDGNIFKYRPTMFGK